MYLITDKASIIRDVQEYLNLISQETQDTRIRTNHSNGKYDEATENAVRYYQSKYGFPESGKLNQETFYSIYSEYLKSKANRENRIRYPLTLKLPIGYGTSHRDMVGINTLLYDISKYYFGASDVKKNSYFSQNTEVAIEELREVFGLQSSPLLDEELYFKLNSEAESIRIFQETMNTVF